MAVLAAAEVTALAEGFDNCQEAAEQEMRARQITEKLSVSTDW